MEKVVIYYALCIIGIFACSCSQLLLKKSANRNKSSLIKSVFNWNVLIAYGIFFCSLIINITALSHGVKVKDLPILESLGYVFVPILSYYYLKEQIATKEILSAFLIILGIVFFYI